MECARHPGVEPAARCVTCGAYLCADCMVDKGRIYCGPCSKKQALKTQEPCGQPAGQWLKGLAPERAFSFLLDDPGWFSRVLVGALLVAASILVVPFFILLGYQLEVMRAAASGADRRLPRWDNIGGKLREGFCYFTVLLVYSLPLIVVVAATVVLGITAGGWASAPLRALAAVLFVAGWLLWLTGLLLFRLAVPAIAARYVATGSIRDALRVAGVAAAIRSDMRPYLVVLLLDCLVSVFVSPLGFILCFVGFAFTGFYGMLVKAHLYGQLACLRATGDESDG